MFPRVRSPAGGVDLLVPEERAAEVTARLAAVAVRGTPEALEVLRVFAGRPSYPEDTGDKRLPAELGLRDELLSFDKGCYIGQESINRIDVMGNVKRRLVGIRAAGGQAGAEIRLGEGGEVVGELTSPVVLPGGEVVGLAVLKEPATAPGTAVLVGSWPGAVSALPMELPALG